MIDIDVNQGLKFESLVLLYRCQLGIKIWVPSFFLRV